MAANGKFAFKARAGTFFRADVVAGRVGTFGVYDAPAAPRRHPVREPDGERVRREEQGRQEALVTRRSQGPVSADRPLRRVGYGWYCWSIESTGFGYLTPTLIQ